MAQLRSNKLRFAATTGLVTTALVGGLTSLPAQAAPAEGTVLAAGSPTAVKDGYIVTLKKSTGLHLANHTTAGPATVASALTGGATANVVTSPGSGSPNRLLKLVP